MRQKQLLAIPLLAMVMTVAASAVSQLAGVRIDQQNAASIMTIRVQGAFTHAEYRPSGNLMLVDLAGVSLAHPDAAIHAVSSPGIQSYRVLGYRSASGGEVARVELNLANGTGVNVNEVEGGVELRIGGGAADATTLSSRVPSGTASAAANVASRVAEPYVAGQAGRTSRITGIAVARGKDGLNIEITGSAPMTAKVMKLTAPDRLVLDIPNSILEGHSREIPVNSGDVKGVRAAHYQSVPSATRVVVDMVAMHDFEVVPAANKLVLKLKSASAVAQAVPAAPTAQEQAASPGAGKDHGVVAPSGINPAQAENKPAVAAPIAVAPIGANVAQTAAAKTAADPPATETASASKGDPGLGMVFVSASYTRKEPDKTGVAAPENQTNQNQINQVQTNDETQSRASKAASHFASAERVTPATNEPVAANSTPTNSTSSSLAVPPAALNAALQQQQQQQQQQPATPSNQMARSCTTGPFTGEIIAGMNLKDVDLKDFFRLINEISGLNVILDPSVKGTLTLVANDLPWDQALAIVLRNNGLECELQGNVLRIASLDTLRIEADARRAQQDAQALAVPKQTITRYLSYGQAKDAVIIIKKFLSPRGDVVPDVRSNALIIEDIPTVMPKIEALLKVLDRKTPEVEIEARVVAATRTFSQDVGTQIALGIANNHTALGGAPAVGPTGITTNAGNLIQTQTTGQIPLFTNLGAIAPTSGLALLNASRYFQLDLILSAAESRGLVKVLSRPRVVTQNNIQAIMKQGQRVPVVTQAQLGGPPTVTYIDAFLKLTVTPQITAENTIFLQVDVENTTADFANVTGAQLNPTLDTQQTTTSILVSDGQTAVIGGAIQTTNNLAYNDVPILGNIPILGNLFKHRRVQTSTQELIFFITPRIIQT